ncbi:tail fiber protein [Salmonella enterica]|uniref:tail fiber protein n=1 Tax=Salmonella enterica TaxID=28901 RepID=UPI0011318141|nr:tail fiber protein [Salmonella enterica]
MGKLTETEKWEDEVYQIETSDPVLGGPDGVSNRPQKQLANRTQWLKKQLEEANNALAGHERSRNHPDATLTDRGFVKLYSGVASMDETMAATPKAVKIAMDNANARLAKDRNLNDVPNKALARTALGLGDSATRNVGRAAGTVAAGDDSRLLAFERTQSGLSAQGVMRISFADDLSNLPSGTRRFVINNIRSRVLPTDDYCFLEVLAKRDTARGTAILLTDSAGNTWSGVRWNADTDSAFTWRPLIQTVSSLGLTDTVNRAANAVQKTGDTMTGNLFLKNDNRMHFAIANADGNVRMWLYKDKGGDGVRLNNGVDGGGEFVFGKNGDFYSPLSIHAGGNTIATDGNIYGSIWGGWLNDWLNNNKAAKNTASLATNGWFRDASTGWIYQWGIVPFAGTTTITVNLPTPFPVGAFMAMGAPASALYWGEDGASGSAAILNNSQLRVTTDNSLPTAWIAIGH